MSWDITVGDFPEVESVGDIPDAYSPGPIGLRDSVIEKIVAAIPSANFEDPSWGQIEGSGWSIEVNIGQSAICDGFMLHVRGGDGAIEAISTIVESVGARAIDCQTGDFFDAAAARASLAEWRDYRDQVAGPG